MNLANSKFWEKAFHWYEWFGEEVHIAFFNQKQSEKNICCLKVYIASTKEEFEKEIMSFLSNKPDYELIDILPFKEACKVRDFYNNYRARGRNGKRGRLTYKQILEKYRKGEITLDKMS